MSTLFEVSPSRDLHSDQLKTYASELCKTIGTSSNVIFVIISGEHGSLTTESSAKHVWLPPYPQLGASEVIQPTGGGNTYLEGFISGWNASIDVVEF